MVALTLVMENLSPREYQLRYDNMKGGRISPKATFLLGEYVRAGGKIKWINNGDDGQEAKARFVYGEHDETVSYTVKDAKAQVSSFDDEGGNWQKNPGAMLRARLATKALRMVAPELIAGMYTADELGGDDEGVPAEGKSETSIKKSSAKSSSKPSRGSKAAGKEKRKRPPKTSGNSKKGELSDTDPSDSELADAVETAAEKEAETKGEGLLKTNNMEANPHSQTDASGTTGGVQSNAQETQPDANEDAGLPPDLCTQSQLTMLKKLIVELDFKDKFDKALETIGVQGAKNLTRTQADKWIARLEQIKAAS